LENYIRVRAFKHRAVPIDQTVLHSLRALAVAILAIPAVAIRKPEQHVHKVSHCGNMQ